MGKRVGVPEVMAVIGGVVLAFALFLPWYSLDNQRANINGTRGRASGPDVTLTGFEVHDILRWLLLAAAAAPIILLYILIRDKKLSWARGELTAVTSVAAFGLLAYTGLIDLPGNVRSLIGREPGLFIAILGTLLMLVGSALRASSNERPRKPPGVL